MMSPIEKLKAPSAARLADRISAVEGEIAALVTAHDQAEAHAVALAGDELKYHEAAEKAALIRSNLSERRERLSRLKAAFAEVSVLSRGEKIKGLRTARGELQQKLADDRTAVVKGRSDEFARHNRALSGMKSREMDKLVEIARHDRAMKGIDLPVLERQIEISDVDVQIARMELENSRETEGRHRDTGDIGSDEIFGNETARQKRRLAEEESRLKSLRDRADEARASI